MRLVRDDVRPSQIITREALENATASIAATGGSTNGVLHLLAIARELGIPFTLDDFDAIAARTPVMATSSRAAASWRPTVHAAGGVALVARELLKARPAHGARATVDGRTLARSRRSRGDAGAGGRRPDGDAAEGDRRPARSAGNLAPEGAW